jgi:hypothetical protein
MDEVVGSLYFIYSKITSFLNLSQPQTGFVLLGSFSMAQARTTNLEKKTVAEHCALYFEKLLNKGFIENGATESFTLAEFRREIKRIWTTIGVSLLWTW